MKALKYAQQVDENMNLLTKHSLQLERDNMLMKNALRLMARNIALTESGDTTFDLRQEDVDYLKKVFDQCNVFAVGEVSHEA